jgi:sRNA-binding protein
MTFTNNIKATIAKLRELFPVAFGLPTQPLKIGVRDDLVAALALDDAEASDQGLGELLAKPSDRRANCSGRARSSRNAGSLW